MIFSALLCINFCEQTSAEKFVHRNSLVESQEIPDNLPDASVFCTHFPIDKKKDTQSEEFCYGSAKFDKNDFWLSIANM